MPEAMGGMHNEEQHLGWVGLVCPKKGREAHGWCSGHQGKSEERRVGMKAEARLHGAE